ncbi:hypothetical protein UlMin_036065 [Ulmus minor]
MAIKSASPLSSSSRSLNLTKSPPIPITFLSTLQTSNAATARTAKWTPLASHFQLSSSTNPTAPVASPATEVESAADVVRKFYDGINGRDLASVKDLIADNCVYEDLIFPRPFVGRKDILEFFESFIDTVGKDLQFAIEKISNEDSSAVGVTWHLEWKGKTFPFSRGCSFYQLEVINGKNQIRYGRDSVEPAIKPGKNALVIIRGVTWLLQQFPQLVDRL